MKTVFRWAFRLFIVMVVLLVAGILLLNTLAREFVAYQLAKETGLEVRIGKVDISLLSPNITIENLIIYNRADFGGSPFIDLPELHVEYDRAALRSRKLHCKLVRVNLARINVVEDKNGRRNFEALQKAVSALPSATGAANQVQPSVGAGGFQFAGIDTLNLTLGKATYLRLNQPDKVEELDMNVNHQVFANIKNQQDFGSVLIVALLKSGANLMQTGGAQTWLQLLSPPKK